MNMKFSIITFLVCLLLASCIQPQALRKVSSTDTEEVVDDNDSNDTDSDEPIAIEVAPSIELTQIIDPNTSTFRKKVSIPKDFSGLLYIAGLNVSSLNSKFVSVSFKFGVDKTEIIVPAITGRIKGGIQNNSNIDVLVLDMSSKPFKQLRLLYDLFDYNDYQEAGTPTDPTMDPTNAGLYCRGLKLQDDPTFEYSQANQLCDTAGENCLYAYAKIGDSVLSRIETVNATPVLVRDRPTYEQYDVLGLGYGGETNQYMLKKCLADSGTQADIQTLIGTNLSSWPLGGSAVIDGVTQFYLGAYQTYGTESQWEISGGALLSPIATTADLPKGLFQYSYDGTGAGGYQSFLFPRAGKINYSKAGVQYYGSSSAFGGRTLQTLAAAGQTKWMDGCNIRVKNYNAASQESINSCNVSATIEVFTEENGSKEILASSKEIKLQLIKAGFGVAQGKTFEAMKTCENNRGCGVGECCFNNRCFGSDVVSKCIDESATTGNQMTGQSCTSDFNCASLCCGNGVCADHINNDLTQVLCSKTPSQTCVVKEFCKQEPVKNCYIVATKDPDGNPSCKKECYMIPTFGDCIKGICNAPVVPIEPPFDVNDPDRCTKQTVYDTAPVNL